MYNNKTILITGGTGSFGQSFIEYILNNFKPNKIIIFSRDELKQFRMSEKLSRYKNVRFFLGDVRDLSRLERAFQGVDIVVHAAALKQVPTLEYNPFEAIQTNIIGSQNVITAALDQRVEKVLFISTDKAAQPVNLYGATKMCAEKLFISSNNYVNKESPTKFSVVRYGNVLGSRGSIVETIINNKKDASLTLTHPDMTRFWITLEQCFSLVNYALENMVGGEIFIPKIPSMKVADIFNILAPGHKVSITGIRPGEKIHEMLITEAEMANTFDVGDYFIIVSHTVFHTKNYFKHKKLKKLVGKDFVYSSNNNSQWLDKKGLKKIISKK